VALKRSKGRDEDALESAFEGARARFVEMLEREAAERTAELERTLSLARAESVSLLAAEERRLAEERRRAVAEQEDRASAQLGQKVAEVQQRVEQRLAGWADDLDRVQQNLLGQMQSLEVRQKQLMADAEARVSADAERLEQASEEYHTALGRLRAELERSTQEAVAGAQVELESHATERRRALHEVGDRLRRRERELNEQIDREQGEALRRIQDTLGDVERRQLEQLKRSVDREAERFAEAAAEQFDAAIKAAREDAARRLARELDRAVAVFSREADSVLGERLSQVADAGVQHLEKRLRQITAGLERQRDEFVETLEKRLADAESTLRDRVEAVTAEGRVERDVLDARLRELAARIDETAARARSRLGSFE
jgi:hypothetical protein